ncbi:MAG: hypothetical protein LKM31_05045 [Sphingobium sp.]|nr:hypothetical protein [Sphingobium sp.]
MGVGIGEGEDHDVERQPGIRCNVERQHVAALHREFVDQTLGQGAGAASEPTSPATTSIPHRRFNGFSLRSP